MELVGFGLIVGVMGKFQKCLYANMRCVNILKPLLSIFNAALVMLCAPMLGILLHFEMDIIFRLFLCLLYLEPLWSLVNGGFYYLFASI